MAARTKAINPIRQILTDRMFTEAQIDKVIPRLHEQYRHQPEALARIVDRWNLIMNSAVVTKQNLKEETDITIRATALPPRKSLMDKLKVNMNTILADIEPDLMLFDPDKLLSRHINVQNLGIIHNVGQHWTILYNAPRGFYLQDWADLTKKVLYIEQNLINLLYDKKEQKEMVVHPLVKSASVVEASFDHIRTRYLFAERTGYRTLSHTFSVQTVLDRPELKDVIMTDNQTYLKKFAPYCSEEEYNCFSNLIKNHDMDEDDADVYERLAELETLRH